MLRPWNLKIEIERGTALSIQLQIVHAITREIHRGRLAPGTALPGSRDLAATLGVNRKTVILAYEELVAQGWLTAEGKRGTFVSPHLPSSSPEAWQPAAAEMPAAPPPAARAAIEFKDGTPDTRLIRFQGLSQAFRHALLSSARSNRLGYDDPRGLPSLRRAVAAMLAMERGLVVDAEGVCLVRGSQMGIFLAARLLVRPGDAVVLEHLTYPPARAAFRSCGADILSVEVDRHGLRTDQLEDICRHRRVRAVYVTPHHQYPTTVMMSAERRLNLLRMAEQYDFTLVEDDYDHEFHYAGGPVMPIASLDRSRRVIYVGSLSKVLAPGLRLGYLAAHPAFVSRCADDITLIDRQGDTVTELAVAELMTSGEVKRHICRALKAYDERRRLLADLLRTHLGRHLDFTMPDGGLAFWVRVVGPADVTRLTQRALAHGVGLLPGAQFTDSNAPVPAFRMGFGNLNAEEITSGIERLRRAFSDL